jgi:tape measure domain-containing protein
MAIESYIQIRVDSKSAERNINQLDKNMVGLGKSTDNSNRSMQLLSKAATAVAAALSVSKIVAYADSWTVVNNKLANSVKEHEKLADVTERVFGIAQKTRSSIDATADLYAKLERSTKSLGLSTEDLEGIVTTINKAFVVSGSAPEEAARAITQLGQAFDSGALFAEEFNSINESGNRLVRALSDSLGLNVKQLKKLGSEGKLTNEVLIAAFREQSKVIGTEYTKTVETFSQRTLQATQNLTKFVGESTLVQSSVAAFGDSMVYASENLETVIDLATGLALVYSARLAPALIASVTGLTALIAAQTRATITTNFLGQRTVAATASMNAMALASRGLATALALVGGPAGLIILTIAGMAALLKGSRDTSNQMDLFAEATKEAEKSLKGLTVAQANFKLQSIEAELLIASKAMFNLKSEADKTFKALSQQLTQGKDSGLVILEQQANDASEKVKELNDRIIKLAAESSALRGSVLSPISAPQEIVAAGPSAKSLITDIGGGKAVSTEKQDADNEARLESNRQYSERYAENERAQTELLRNELAVRQADHEVYGALINSLEEGSFEQMRARVDQQQFLQSNAASNNYIAKVAEIEAERQLLLDNDMITDTARTDLLASLSEQKLIAAQTLEQSLTEVAAQGKAARNSITTAEFQAASQVVGTLGANIVSAFQGQSKKMFEAGKVLAIADTIINTYASATSAYKSMASIPIIGPALGAAAAAAAVVGGLANVKRIKSQKFSASGGGGGGSYSSGGGATGGGSIPTGASSAPQGPQVPTTVIDFRARPGQAFTSEDVLDILGSVTGVTVINNGLQNAQRLGEI